MFKSNDNLWSFIFCIICSTLSLYFSPLYTEGDQADYTDFYYNVSAYNFSDGYYYYKVRLGASEPLFYVLIYYLSPFIDKIYLFTIINSIFSFFLAKCLLALRMHPMLLIPLSVNFYLLVLFLTAERLKVSLTIFTVALTLQNARLKLATILTSLLFHFQTSFLIISNYTYLIRDVIRSFIRDKLSKKIISIAIMIIIGLSFFIIFREGFIFKLRGYSEYYGGINDTIKPLAFLFITLVYSRNSYLLPTLMHLPIIIGAYLIGDLRMTIFSYFIFFYFAVQYNRGLNIGILVTTVYFLIKGIDFLSNVLIYGKGFMIE